MNSLIVADVMGLLMLFTIILGIFTKSKREKSSNYLVAVAICFIVCCVSEIGVSFLSGFSSLSALIWIVCVIYSTISIVTIIAFLIYCYVFISEKTKINKLFLYIPLSILILDYLYLFILSVSGNLFKVSGGTVTIVGRIPIISWIAVGLTIIYVSVLALIFRKKIGNQTFLFWGVCCFTPYLVSLISIITSGTNYSYAAGTAALLIYFILQENRATFEKKDKEQNELIFKNTELSNKNEIQDIRLQEITTLNDKLKHLNYELIDFNNIISSAGYGVWHIYIKNGAEPRMKANEKMGELLAIDINNMSEEEVYSSWHDRIPEESIKSVNKSVEEMIKDGFSENTYAWDHPTKGIIFVRCGGNALKRRDGTIVLSGYHADVTEIVRKEKKQEEDLKNALDKAKTHAIEVQNQLDIIYTIAKSFNAIYYVDLNDYSFIELGSTVEGVTDIIGQKGDARDSYDKMLKYLVSPDQVEEMREFVNLDTLNDRLKDTEWISKQFVNSRDGKWSEGMFVAAKRNENGVFDHVIWSTRNINEHKQKEVRYQEELLKAAEEAKAANNAKTSFLFNMSHDIRTPMNAIMGFRDLLEKNQNDPEKRQDYLNKIQEASSVLLSIINNVLEMARIEKGTLEIDEVAWSVEQFLDSLISVFKEMMDEKNIEFKSSMNVIHHYVFLDPIKLREIFINILSNAYKYTNRGGKVILSVEELPSTKEGYVTYKTSIEDTGIGMSEEFLPHLFEEFTREHNTTEAKIEGTGLGMPIVRRLVELLDGEIHVESKKGLGTKFEVIISHKIADKTKLLHSENETISPESFSGKRILLVEDNDLNAEIATEILQEAGFIIERAEDGLVCVEKLKNAQPYYYDLILMDIQMPNMNGYEATKTIRALDDFEKSQTPIIAMTANAFEEDKKEAYKVGMNGHLAKPIDTVELIKTLARIIG